MGEQAELFTRVSWFRRGGVVRGWIPSRSISNFSDLCALQHIFLTGVEAISTFRRATSVA